jgi:hypothetical protein
VAHAKGIAITVAAAYALLLGYLLMSRAPLVTLKWQVRTKLKKN